MNLAPELLAAATRENICPAYYRLCAEYPYVAGMNKTPYKEILAAAEDRLHLTKLSGPGSVLELVDLPDGLSLRFILQSGGTVETDFSVRENSAGFGGTFAIMCNEASKHAGLPPPNPGYPRPYCSSASAFVAVFDDLRHLLITLSRAVGDAG
jgi:hypothetical protein